MNYMCEDVVNLFLLNCNISQHSGVDTILMVLSLSFPFFHSKPEDIGGLKYTFIWNK